MRGGTDREQEEEEEEEEDEKREASIASASSLRPNFKPKCGVTSAQISKLQELHKRRLQIKARSKVKKKPKGSVESTSTFHGKDMNCKECTDENPSKSTANSSDPSLGNSLEHTSFTEQGKEAARKALKERPKLHWGLETKERWERKSNM